MATQPLTAPTVTTRMTSWLQTRHRTCLQLFALVVLAHWAEHLTQAAQIYLLGWPVPQARGVLGVPFPWLVTSEVMHYGYAIVMLVMLWLLRSGFEGAARQWWMLAFGLQFWHHVEHLLLLAQVTTGHHLGGGAVPMSLIQFFVPRVELHLFYNTIVTIPMVVAMVLHARRSGPERDVVAARDA